MWVVAGAVFVLAVAAFVVRAVRRDRAMHAALMELQERNMADTVFRSDSAAQVLLQYVILTTKSLYNELQDEKCGTVVPGTGFRRLLLQR